MGPFRSFLAATPAIVCVTVLTLLGSACRRERVEAPKEQTKPIDTTAADTTLADSLVPVQWDTALGRGILVSGGESPESASVIRSGYVEGRFSGGTLTDVQPLIRSRWDLVGRSGAFGAAQLVKGVAADSSEGCVMWPSAILSGARNGWRAAFEEGVATVVPLDSVEAMSSADSSRFVIDITRLASSTRGPDDSLFASIPFVVRDAYHFRTGEVDGVMGLVQRSIHSEANPREEHLFFVAERPVGSADPYRIGYTTRAAGREGGVPVVDVLTLVTFSKTHHLALVISHEYEDGGAIWLIERTIPARWRATWRSAIAGCQ